MNLKDIYDILNKELNSFFIFSLTNKKQLKDFEHLLEEYTEEDYYDYLSIKDFINNNNYKRVKIEELSNDVFEFVLIIWKPNAKTKIHDHPNKGCLLKVLEGSLDEELFDNELNNLAFYKLNKNETSYIESNTILHSISNNTNNYAVSLHIYSPSNYKTNYYQ